MFCGLLPNSVIVGPGISTIIVIASATGEIVPLLVFASMSVAEIK